MTNDNHLIFQLGQSQDDRLSPELDIHFADVDELTTADLLRLTQAFAKFVNYYRDRTSTPVGNWSNFFPDEAAIESLLNGEGASTSPHLALFLAFLELYKLPQNIINQITTRHLDFYYQDVLRLKPQGAIADKVYLLLELKKNVAPIRILPTDLFSAGKDVTNVELIYAPTRETVINAAKVESLRSIYFDRLGNGNIHYAPIANSADGLGGKLAANEPKWFGFGNRKLPPAEVGFAIASGVLRMQEGDRQVTLSLQLNNVDSTQLNNISLQDAFEVYITGEKSWLFCAVTSNLSTDNVLTLNFTVPATEKAVVDYNSKIHGYFYNAQAPIVQVLLNAENTNLGYNNFRNVTIQTAAVTVAVSNITSLHLESDGGTLDPKKAFLPFTPQPSQGSRFLVGYAEALTKKLSEVNLTIQWKDAPPNFSSHYMNYGKTIDNNSFTANVTFQDGGNWTYSSNHSLFNSNNAASTKTLTFTPSIPAASITITEGMKVYALNTINTIWAMDDMKSLLLQKTVYSSYQTVVSEPRSGFITFSLERDFLHETYRQKYVEYVLKYSKSQGDLIILNEPYTPAIQSISLSYSNPK